MELKELRDKIGSKINIAKAANGGEFTFFVPTSELQAIVAALDELSTLRERLTVCTTYCNLCSLLIQAMNEKS